MIFYLGINNVDWLWSKNEHIPFFVSDRRLKRYKKLKPANFIWALDSGGFTELHKYGKWITTPKEYAERTKFYSASLGKMQFAAIQDWMCEASARKKTKKSVNFHQKKTIENWFKLNDLAPKIPWLPVLQGQTPKDYIRHLEDYRDQGVQSTFFGLGSVCRRANSQEIVDLVEELTINHNILLHGFGVKSKALLKINRYLKSSDSMAWSVNAAYEKVKPKYKTCNHKACSSCYSYAKWWYRKNLKNYVVY